MIKKELIEEVSRRAQVTKKESRQVIDTFLEEIKKALGFRSSGGCNSSGTKKIRKLVG